MPDLPHQSPPYSIAFDHDRLFRLRANGSQSLILDFNKNIDDKADPLILIHQLTQYLIAHPPRHLINIIPASFSVTLVFSVVVIPDDHWQDYFCQSLDACQGHPLDSQTHVVEVCYETNHYETGPNNTMASDSNSVCEILQCNTSQLIEAHCSVHYRVDMLGFLPGFAYLSGLSEALQLPRKSKPTLNVPAGSVAIGGQYSAIYPVQSPGGWHVIGHTHFKCIDWQRAEFCPFKPLDTVRFVPISLDQWLTQQ
ncbi:5-oxoprolinase subunit B family protein [Marinicella rhabdoformis]|uniref:5-oxoprolinase subunit B family protein n=1 Tax=Marinicella rhabdoformis TaxID=2580566 RepID=UPI0012AEBE28|nr:carboxyltransferase domain-containing protein [Marinicella rhabdoformis]